MGVTEEKKAIEYPNFAEVEAQRWSLKDRAMREIMATQGPRMASLKIGYDNDGIFDFGYPDGDGPQFLPALAGQYADVGAQFVSLGVGSCFAWNFRPRVMETPWLTDDSFTSLWWRQMRDYHLTGTDPLTYVLEGAAARELPVYANFRFNRYHPEMTPPLVDSWYSQHPQYRLSPASCPWLQVADNPWAHQHSINLAIDEVQQHLVGDLIDVVENYPVAGLQLELMRAVPFFELSEPDKCGRMNAFLRALRVELDRLGEKRGSRIELVLWLPTEEHHRILRSAWPDRFLGDPAWGLDPETWIEEGLVDRLIPSVYSADLNMSGPVERPGWVDTARAAGVPVHAACMNLLPSDAAQRNPEVCGAIARNLLTIRDAYSGLFLFNTAPFQLAEILYLGMD